MEIDIDSLFAPAMTCEDPAAVLKSLPSNPAAETDPLEKLVHALESPNADVRLQAIRTIGGLHVKSGLPVLSRMLADAEAQVADAAGEALVSFGKTSLTVVEQFLLHPDTSYTLSARIRAVDVAGQLICTESEVLLRRLLDDDDLGDRAAGYLVQNLGCDPYLLLGNKVEHWRMRVANADRLSGARDRDSLLLLYTEAMEERNPLAVRLSCLRALSSRNTNHSSEPFLSILGNSANPPELRAQAARALVRTSPHAAGAVRSFASENTTPEQVREACQQVLVEMELLHHRAVPS